MSTDYCIEPQVTFLSASARGLVERLSLATRSRTSLNESAVRDEVADVIRIWEDRPLPALAALQDFPADPISAIEFVANTLRVNQDEVCKAVGIAPRTFYGWKMHGHRPRARSLGVLWPMTRVIYLLDDAHPNLEEWFQGSQQAQNLFGTGDAEGLAALEAQDWVTEHPLRRFSPPDDHLPDEPHEPARSRRIIVSTPILSELQRHPSGSSRDDS